ncbi:UvrD-helicase domain-containing protein [Gramella sp. AN32]|uniref:DNA 3'-5' helicase n=1 Tax=Christiangramia antarctica TaxID=2058158 RepID=A0ABW5X675_9FLAO|nr:UvrD-helicase domain-containing protein [Gramella sp. AN32]MCM4156182.1 hypothetical protein [Gramella sp. AN32]
MKKFKELDKYSELNPIRDHIKLEFRETEPGKELKAIKKDLAESLKPEYSRAIVFCTSRKLTEEAAAEVNSEFKENDTLANKAGFYHAGMDSDARERTFEQYKTGSLAILFATKAFGMGMDIRNIHHVYHLGPSGSFEDYLQEVGRAGRNEDDLKKAGYSSENPIQAICFHSKDSFPSYRDWIQRTQISWNDICNVYEVFKEYRAQFITGKEERQNREFLPIPLNTLSTSLKYMDTESDLGSLFRLSLYWLQQADRIHSRFYVPAFLEFQNEGFFDRETEPNIADDDLKKLFGYVFKIYDEEFRDADSTLVDGTGLMKYMEVNREKMFLLILKAQKKGLLKLVNELNVKPTENSRHDEAIQKIARDSEFQFLEAVNEIALKLVEEFRRNEEVELLNETLQRLIQEVEESVLFEKFLDKLSSYADREYCEIYLRSKDLRKERKKQPEFASFMNTARRTQPELLEILEKQRRILKSDKSSGILKTAFFVLNLHPEISITSKFSEDSKAIIQVVKLEATKTALGKFVTSFCKDGRSLLIELMKEESRVVDINELLLRLPFKEPKYSEVENLFYLLRKVGYIRFQGGLIPMAIEMKFDKLEALGDLPEDEKLGFTYVETIRMKKLRLIVLECFSELEDKDKQTDLIRDYFQGKDSKEIIKLIETYSKNHEKLLGPYRAEALKERVSGLNPNQLSVYKAGMRSHVSVLAGPGTGKTHTLVLRVARLIQEENIPPHKILVLAYNRAVVEELKMRLKSLFVELGYKKLINSLQVYTFSALTGSVLQQNGVQENDLNVWEKKFLELYRERGRSILGRFADVEYVFIDEFQDITNRRLEIIKIVAPKFRSFITAIGDPNQSIYGFDRVKENGERGPEAYYALFNEEYSPEEKMLTINYRSTPEIIETSKLALPGSARNLPIEPNPETEKFEGVVDIYEGSGEWLSRFYRLLQEEGNNEIAILFRTNEELYKDYELINELVETAGYKLEIKGSSTSFIRQREIAYILNVIIRNRAGALIEDKEGIGAYVNDIIKPKFPNWDKDLLDDFVRLFNYYYDQYNENHTYGDFVDFVKEITAKDDGQLFKILKTQRNITTPTVILTTIHRVKGMEYQNVIVPASTAKLPFEPRTREYSEVELQEIIDEEKRLRYVAYSRAKSNLIVEISAREKSLEAGECYLEAGNVNNGIPVKSGDNNIVISWKAGNDPNSIIHETIHTQLKIGDQLSIRRNDFNNWGVWYGNVKVERFIGNYAGRFNGSNLKGIFVDSITRYTAEECQLYDERHGANYYTRWSQDAQNRGFIYLVNFFGYAAPENEIEDLHRERIKGIIEYGEMLLENSFKN